MKNVILAVSFLIPLAGSAQSLQQNAYQASVIISEMTEVLNKIPYFSDTSFYEYWNWPAKFIIYYDLEGPKGTVRSLEGYQDMPCEQYFERFKELHLIRR